MDSNMMNSWIERSELFVLSCPQATTTSSTIKPTSGYHSHLNNTTRTTLYNSKFLKKKKRKNSSDRRRKRTRGSLYFQASRQAARSQKQLKRRRTTNRRRMLKIKAMMMIKCSPRKELLYFSPKLAYTTTASSSSCSEQNQESERTERKSYFVDNDDSTKLVRYPNTQEKELKMMLKKAKVFNISSSSNRIEKEEFELNEMKPRLFTTNHTRRQTHRFGVNKMELIKDDTTNQEQDKKGMSSKERVKRRGSSSSIAHSDTSIEDKEECNNILSSSSSSENMTSTTSTKTEKSSQIKPGRTTGNSYNSYRQHKYQSHQKDQHHTTYYQYHKLHHSSSCHHHQLPHNTTTSILISLAIFVLCTLLSSSAPNFKLVSCFAADSSTRVQFGQRASSAALRAPANAMAAALYSPLHPTHQQSAALPPYGSKAVAAPQTTPATQNLQASASELGPGGGRAEVKPLMSSSSSMNRNGKQANELDVFLDDINHRELSAIAAGEPIGNEMFRPKLLKMSSSNRNEAEAANDSDNNKRKKKEKEAAENENENETGQEDEEVAGKQTRASLDEAHSEHQIYSECALILQRTYVKNINDPKHQLIPFGKTEQACIGYKDVNKAIELAKQQLKFKELKKKRKQKSQKNNSTTIVVPFDIIHSTLEPPEDLVAALGELNQATTQILAQQFDLSHDELLNGLPLIDMSKTKFWPMCPLFVRQQDLHCKLARFRSLTGHCNNLKHPTWGAAMTPYARYLPPVHPDGIQMPRKSIVSEITFELSEGHRELHTNLAPSMPAPVFDHNHHNRIHHHHQHHHHHHHHLNRRLERAEVQPRALGDAAASAEGGGGTSSVETIASAASVAFASHAQMDTFGVPPPHGEHMGAADSPLMMGGAMSPPNEMSPPHPMHYQQSVSPSVGYLATASAPASAVLAGHDHHLPDTAGDQRHLVAASSANPAAPPSPDTNALATSPLSMSQRTHSRALELPSARLITSVVHRDIDQPSHDFSILFMSWGQVINHDMTRAAQSPPSIKCCGQEEPKHKLCLPIKVPANDPLYSRFNVKCLEFRRTLAGLRPNCVLGPRVHQNAITHLVDASFVYGSSEAQAEALRTFKKGRLREQDVFKREGLKPLLPPQEEQPDADCIARPRDLFCFFAGDVRVNEQTHLTVLHTIYMREHNRLAQQLAQLNPHWDDERIYQEARHIVAAGVQHVLLNEYLPLLIGRKMVELYNLTSLHTPHADGHAHGHPNAAAAAYWHGYDPTVTTSVSNSFAAAAFRQGHTMVQGSIERFSKFHEFIMSEKLRNLFKRPFLLYQPGVMDELTSGMINQPAQSYDPFVSEDISGHLFQPPEAQIGHDLPAINLQRGREQGLPGYNLFREWCGLPRAETFEQLEPYLTNHTAFQYSRLYKHVDDIDLWSGGVSERKLPGAAIGPTFACIIARQFSNTRRGDRFWYENPGLPSSFTPEQLAELRKITIAKILCTNSDDLPTIQRFALRMAHPVLNPRLPCEQLPELDLRYWQEE